MNRAIYFIIVLLVLYVGLTLFCPSLPVQETPSQHIIRVRADSSMVVTIDKPLRLEPRDASPRITTYIDSIDTPEVPPSRTSIIYTGEYRLAGAPEDTTFINHPDSLMVQP